LTRDGQQQQQQQQLLLLLPMSRMQGKDTNKALLDTEMCIDRSCHAYMYSGCLEPERLPAAEVGTRASGAAGNIVVVVVVVVVATLLCIMKVAVLIHTFQGAIGLRAS